MQTLSLIDVLTQDNMGGLPRKVTVLYPVTMSKEPAEFIRGLVYSGPTRSRVASEARTDFEERIEIELIYEGLKSGIPYVLKPTSLSEVTENLEIIGNKDYRYFLFGNIFGSTEIYKAFFEVLNQDRVMGRIKDQTYIDIVVKVKNTFDEMSTALSKTSIFSKLRVLRQFRRLLRQDSLISYYMHKAESYLMRGR
ncbi:hypothetical protein HYX03_00475 [Candidatus Woesearchaeota archaeon]|nr:hypothetical protein [Candidatus Woesearchaeota archaeon]